jgi:hypothetical protein
MDRPSAMNSHTRKVLLIAVLLVCAGVFFYERFVVKRQRDRVEAELVELANDMSVTYNEAEIDALVGRPPTVINDSPYQKTVRYTWQFLPWRSYQLYVQYRKMRGRSILSDVHRVKPEPFSPPVERLEEAERREYIERLKAANSG